jgi:hypothetical protein
MILIDTSIWIEFFKNKIANKENINLNISLEQIITDNEVATCLPIYGL